MRILILSAIFFISFYTLKNNTFQSITEVDAVKTQQGAPKRNSTYVKKKVKNEPASDTENDSSDENKKNKLLDEANDSQDMALEDSNYNQAALDGRKISSEIEKIDEIDEKEHPKELKWEDELAQVLDELEPENAEEIFKSYLEQKENFEASLQNLVREENDHQDIEYMISELETEHEERLKEIFGPHFDKIKEHQSNFLELESR